MFLKDWIYHLIKWPFSKLTGFQQIGCSLFLGAGNTKASLRLPTQEKSWKGTKTWNRILLKKGGYNDGNWKTGKRDRTSRKPAVQMHTNCPSLKPKKRHKENKKWRRKLRLRRSQGVGITPPQRSRRMLCFQSEGLEAPLSSPAREWVCSKGREKAHSIFTWKMPVKCSYGFSWERRSLTWGFISEQPAGRQMAFLLLFL